MQPHTRGQRYRAVVRKSPGSPQQKASKTRWYAWIARKVGSKYLTRVPVYTHRVFGHGAKE